VHQYASRLVRVGFVFGSLRPRRKKGHIQQQCVRDSSGDRLKITTAAGIAPRQGKTGEQVAGIKFHNTRNTAATRMIQAGLSEVEAMESGGWMTRNIFEHYRINNDAAKQQAAKKMAARSELRYGIG
jgi:integrase